MNPEPRSIRHPISRVRNSRIWTDRPRRYLYRPPSPGPIGRLVKIDPKSIGVGQYQHDVEQKKLMQGLERTVESCVNRVGVDLNTASWALRGTSRE